MCKTITRDQSRNRKRGSMTPLNENMGLNLDTKIDSNDLANDDDIAFSDYPRTKKNNAFKTTGMVSKVGSRQQFPSNTRILRNVRSNTQQGHRNTQQVHRRTLS